MSERLSSDRSSGDPSSGRPTDRRAAPQAVPISGRVCLAALALAAAIALAACAARGAKAPQDTAPPTRTDAPPLFGRPDDLREQIRALDEQIARDLGTAQVEVPDASAAAAMSATPVAEARLTCERVPSARCGDLCKLADSICDAAARICDLAHQLPGDAWAAERCDAAKVSCQRASERCCGECAVTP